MIIMYSRIAFFVHFLPILSRYCAHTPNTGKNNRCLLHYVQEAR